jgi:arylsulfatase I/J
VLTNQHDCLQLDQNFTPPPPPLFFSLYRNTEGTAFEELLFTNRVVKIIDEHDPATPLFIYYAMHLLHSPLCVPAPYLQKFSFILDNEDRKYVAAMVNYLDDVVGRIEDTLREASLWDSTLLVWSSDNGARCAFFGRNP